MKYPDRNSNVHPINRTIIIPNYDSIAQLPSELKRNDHKDWARRILYRQEQGESLPRISLELAREALHIAPPAQREPGSDDA